MFPINVDFDRLNASYIFIENLVAKYGWRSFCINKGKYCFGLLNKVTTNLSERTFAKIFEACLKQQIEGFTIFKEAAEHCMNFIKKPLI